MKQYVDIIMGIYNCEKYLRESIDSILNQTFTKWRLIICDDGSTDNTYQIAKEYANKYADKIILLKNKNNKGLNYTLNKCLSRASSEYIARMDGDDYCNLDRLKKEFNFLESHPEYSFVSSNAILFDENGNWGKISNVEKPEKIDFIKGSPFCHAAVMIRTNDIKSVGGYSVAKKLLRVEDYHLWFKLYSKGLKGFNIIEDLYYIRDDRDAASRRTWKNRLNEFHVKRIGFKMLNIPIKYRIYIFRPLLVGLVPKYLYRFIHRKKLEKNL